MLSLSRTKTSLTYKLFSLFVTFTFVLSMCVMPTNANAQGVFNLPAPGTMVTPSVGYFPATMAGMTIHPENPLHLDFIVTTGEDNLEGEAFKKESQKLINYFLATLTVPDDEMWVNLSPYEKDRIIADGLGGTEMGRDMLIQDYMLKQLTASLMYPEEELGDAFWKKVYAKSQAKFGTVEIPTNTFNKVWIVPQEAVVYVNGTNVLISESHLKVMLEEDYLALESNTDSAKHGLGTMTKDDITIMTEETKEIIREVILPEIEREVNEGKTFANLRQIYNSMILATWYKQNLKESVLGHVYMDQNKINGINLEDTQIKEKVYNQYVEAFEKGVYNYIKEDRDPVTREMIPRKYFSGGLQGLDTRVRQKGPEDGGVSAGSPLVQARRGGEGVNSIALRLDLAGAGGVGSSPVTTKSQLEESVQQVMRDAQKAFDELITNNRGYFQSSSSRSWVPIATKNISPVRRWFGAIDTYAVHANLKEKDRGLRVINNKGRIIVEETIDVNVGDPEYSFYAPTSGRIFLDKEVRDVEDGEIQAALQAALDKVGKRQKQTTWISTSLEGAIREASDYMASLGLRLHSINESPILQGWTGRETRHAVWGTLEGESRVAVAILNNNRQIRIFAARVEATDAAEFGFSPIGQKDALNIDVNDLTMPELHQAIDAALESLSGEDTAAGSSPMPAEDRVLGEVSAVETRTVLEQASKGEHFDYSDQLQEEITQARLSAMDEGETLFLDSNKEKQVTRTESGQEGQSSTLNEYHSVMIQRKLGIITISILDSIEVTNNAGGLERAETIKNTHSVRIASDGAAVSSPANELEQKIGRVMMAARNDFNELIEKNGDIFRPRQSSFGWITPKLKLFGAMTSYRIEADFNEVRRRLLITNDKGRIIVMETVEVEDPDNDYISTYTNYPGRVFLNKEVDELSDGEVKAAIKVAIQKVGRKEKKEKWISTEVAGVNNEAIDYMTALGLDVNSISEHSFWGAWSRKGIRHVAWGRLNRGDDIVVTVENDGNGRVRVFTSRIESTDYAALYFIPLSKESYQLNKHVSQVKMEELQGAIDAAFAQVQNVSSPVKPGGIDFNPNNLDLQEQGQALDFTLDNSMLQNLQPGSVNGIVPVIINIAPITNFVPLLGKVEDSHEKEKTDFVKLLGKLEDVEEQELFIS